MPFSIIHTFQYEYFWPVFFDYIFMQQVREIIDAQYLQMSKNVEKWNKTI